MYECKMSSEKIFRLLCSCLIFHISFAATACDMKKMKADVIFLIDSSSSVEVKDFIQIKNFLHQFVDDVEIGSNDVRVGIVLYASAVVSVIDMNSYADQGALKTAISNIQRIWGATATHLGIQRVYDIFKNDNRSSVEQIMVVLTDGKSSDSGAAKDFSRKLHTAGVDTISIGISNETSWAELNDMASSKKDVFTVDNFDNLRSVMHDVFQRACQGQLQPEGDDSQSSIPQSVKIVGIIAAGLAAIGATLCCWRVCYTAMERRSKEDKEQLPNSDCNKVSPSQEGNKGPLPMTPENEFVF